MSGATRPRAPPRLGFLGVGWIGRHRMEAILATGAVEVAAIADPSAEMAAEAAAAWRRVRGSSRPSTSFSMLELDGVVIATPSALHAEQSIRALERGAAVFCQKPLGRTAAEARAVVDAARAADRLLGVDLSYRFTEGMRRIREIVRAGGARARLRGRSRLPQRLRAGQALVLRPGALRRRLRHGSRRAPRRPRAVDARLAGGGGRLRRACWPAASRSADALDAVEDYAVADPRARDRNGGAARLLVAPAGRTRRDHLGGVLRNRRRGARSRNVDGSFYDFNAERYRGTARETLAAPPDAWGGRAAADFGNAACRGRALRCRSRATRRRRPRARPDLRALKVWLSGASGEADTRRPWRVHGTLNVATE